MDLTDAYVGYLQDQANPATRAELSNALEKYGYILEVKLLREYEANGSGWSQILSDDSPWKSRRIFLDLQPPDEAAAGDLWFDPLEIVPMLLVPAEGPVPGERYAPEALARMQPYVGWMSLRPVANWQYAAFLRMARLEPRIVQLSPPLLLLDSKRILQGKPSDPVNRLTCPEALLCASWFGKGLCGQDEWQAAARLLHRSLWEEMWEPLRREWAGAFSEGVYAVATPSNVVKDWDEFFEDPQSRKEMFFDEWQAPLEVGFRTAVQYQFGLLKQPWHDPGAMVDVQLGEVLKRKS